MQVSTMIMMKNLQKEYDNEPDPGYEDDSDPGDYGTEIKELNFND